MSAEQAIKQSLDGWLFRLSMTTGCEGRPYVRAIKVPKDYIPDHSPLWDYAGDPEQPHYNAAVFTLEEEDTIIEMRRQGKRWADIATTIKRCINTTRDHYLRICKERGIEPIQRIEQKKPQRLSDQVKAQIASMRDTGMSYDTIAAQMGLTRWTVADCYNKICKRRRRSD